MAQGIGRLLMPEERVVWEGRPKTGLLFRRNEGFHIGMSLIWAVFFVAVFWDIGFWRADSPFFLKLFSLPFVVAGFFALVGRFWIDMWVRRRLRYAVTNRRIMIMKGDGASVSRSFDITRLPALELEERPDGSGTIKFGETDRGIFASRDFGFWIPALSATPQFLAIEKARSVFELIQKQK
ncbi:MAG: hypothetical protein AB7O39_07495 [Flavobacteriaceae bacterium]